MKYDAVFYDLDGTIIDSVPVIMDSFHQTYIDVLGECTRTDEDLMSYIGRPLTDTFHMHDEVTARKLFDRYLEHNIEMLEKDCVQAFPGVVESLKRLKGEGIYQGIVTSKRKRSAEITIKYKGLDDVFDMFLFGDDLNKAKPNPEPLYIAAGKAGITDMSRILYVGDAMPDILCAQAAGSDFALVDWTRMPKEEIISQNPTYVLKSLDDISCIISG